MILLGTNIKLQVRTYINGTLYSILSLPSMKQSARSRGLDELLQSVAGRSDETFGRQLSYVMEQLLDEEGLRGVASDEENDEDISERAWDPQLFEDENDDIMFLESENGSYSIIQGQFCSQQHSYSHTCTLFTDFEPEEDYLCSRYGMLPLTQRPSPELSPLRYSHQNCSVASEPLELSQIGKHSRSQNSPLPGLPLNRPVTPKLVPSSTHQSIEQAHLFR